MGLIIEENEGLQSLKEKFKNNSQNFEKKKNNKNLNTIQLQSLMSQDISQEKSDKEKE
jgi:hypothetical protein